MKHTLIISIIALTVTGCSWFGEDEPILMTHNDSIYQMLTDTIAVLDDHQEVFYLNPDGSFVLDIGDYPVEWCPGDDPPFWTELDLILTRDSIVNDYRLYSSNERIRRSSFPLDHIGSVETIWHNRAIGREAPEGRVIPRKYGDTIVMQPTIRTMVVHLNTMYKKSNGQIEILSTQKSTDWSRKELSPSSVW